MKILVIAAPRSGGRYFIKSLSETYGLEYIHEPGPKLFRNLPENACVKILTYKPYKDIKNINLEKLILGFDKVFLLSRRDKQDHLRSLWNMWGHSHNMYKTYEWKDEYLNTTDKHRPADTTVEQVKKMIDSLESDFKILSKKLKQDVIYYEDLYYNTEKVDLQGLVFKPDLTRRLRIEDNKTVNRLL